MNNRTLAAGVLLGVSGVAIFNVLPLYLGAAAEQLNLSPDKTGLLATIELSAIALASLLGPLWVSRVNWRVTAYAATSIIILGDLLTTTLSNYELILLTRVITGFFGEGLVYAIAISALAESDEPERAFGYAVSGQVLSAAVGLYFLPPLVAILGVNSVIYYVAAIAFASLWLVHWMPEASTKRVQAISCEPRFPSFVPLIGLAVMSIWYLCIGSFWAFAERIGDEAGLELQVIGTALSISTIAGLLGSISATFLKGRFGRMWPFLAAVVLQIFVFIAISMEFSEQLFFAALIVFNIGWNFGVTYLLAMIASSDSQGKFVVLAPVSQSIGTAGGPALTGLMAVQYGYGVVIPFDIVCCVIAVIIYVPFALRVTRGDGVVRHCES